MSIETLGSSSALYEGVAGARGARDVRDSDAVSKPSSCSPRCAKLNSTTSSGTSCGATARRWSRALPQGGSETGRAREKTAAAARACTWTTSAAPSCPEATMASDVSSNATSAESSSAGAAARGRRRRRTHFFRPTTSRPGAPSQAGPAAPEGPRRRQHVAVHGGPQGQERDVRLRLWPRGDTAAGGARPLRRAQRPLEGVTRTSCGMPAPSGGARQPVPLKVLTTTAVSCFLF